MHVSDSVSRGLTAVLQGRTVDAIIERQRSRPVDCKHAVLLERFASAVFIAFSSL